MMTPTEFLAAIHARIAICINASKEIAPTLPNVEIKSTLKSRVAGMATRKCIDGTDHFSINFNYKTAFTSISFETYINEVVPHEFAHILCMHNPSLGKNHDCGWKRIAKLLGSTGERTYPNKFLKEGTAITKLPRGETYVYTSTNSKELSVSGTIHRRIQMGNAYAVSEAYGGGRIDSTCKFKKL